MVQFLQKKFMVEFDCVLKEYLRSLGDKNERRRYLGHLQETMKGTRNEVIIIHTHQKPPKGGVGFAWKNCWVPPPCYYPDFKVP